MHWEKGSHTQLKPTIQEIDIHHLPFPGKNQENQVSFAPVRIKIGSKCHNQASPQQDEDVKSHLAHRNTYEWIANQNTTRIVQ